MNQPSAISANAGPDHTINVGETVTLTSTFTTGSSILWSPDIDLSCTDCAEPEASPTETTVYLLTSVDANGCVAVDTVTVFVNPESIIFVPNAFTPDNSGTNDVLYVRTEQVELLYFAVYNRWGELVFETTEVTEGWDGTYDGKPMDQAVFVYYVEARLNNGERVVKTGNVTLIR